MEKQGKPVRPAKVRALSMLGLCKKAGRMTVGVPQVCDALREGKLHLVVYAAQAAENAIKRVCDKAKFYETEALAVEATAEELGHAVGKSGAVAAVGVADAGFAKALKTILGSSLPSQHTMK